jgi:hypothetical protein
LGDNVFERIDNDVRDGQQQEEEEERIEEVSFS